jgi:hypothetical protein
MPDFGYVLDLLEAKGWYLYKGIPRASLPEVISGGKALSLIPGTYYHLIPATTRDALVEEVLAAVAHAIQTNAMPIYNDQVNQGRVDGIFVTDSEFAFVSKPDSFTFDPGSRPVIQDAIKFNLSNYNTFFFNSIDEIGSFLDKRGIAPQLPPVLPSQLRWTFVHRSEDPEWTAIYPENPGSILFRGQGKRFMPCVPTATRGIGIEARALHELSPVNQARLVLNFIRTEWFIELLQESAAVKWLKERRIFLDEMAVAQHYGLPTGYIDLTQSFEVAAFFACCRYDPAIKSWAPVADGEGVVYAVDWRELPPGEFIRPINLQVFPRPSEQWGWTCELRLGDDFDKLPFVRKFVFKHDLQISRRILAMFSQGKDLFPDDPLAELADEIVSAPVLPVDIAERIAANVINDPQGKPGSTVEEVLSLVQQFTAIKLSPHVGIADIARINAALDDVWGRKKEGFFRGIGFRLVRQRKDELPNE